MTESFYVAVILPDADDDVLHWDIASLSQSYCIVVTQLLRVDQLSHTLVIILALPNTCYISHIYKRVSRVPGFPVQRFLARP